MTTPLPPWAQVHAREAVGSTSDEARALAEAGAPDGTVVWALEQHGGRGRLGRRWSSPPGNLYLSVVLRRGAARRAPELGFCCALAVADLADSALPPPKRARLKWPNDVLLDGAKLAGVLPEVVAAPPDARPAPEAVVVAGIGVNLRHAPADLPYPAATLAGHGAELSPAEALARLLHALHRRLEERDAGFAARTLPAWRARGPDEGTPLVVTPGGAALRGTFAGLDADGALLLRTEAGVRRIVAGEVGFG